MLITMVALLSVIVNGEKEYGIWRIPNGAILNLFLFKSKANTLGSSVSIWTYTVEASLKGFLNVSIDDVLFPTAVDIGYGSIIVGSRPLPSTLNSHLPTAGFSKIILPVSTTSRLLGEY
jgi:hypothetical protein